MSLLYNPGTKTTTTPNSFANLKSQTCCRKGASQVHRITD